jgi:iron(III) transport system ATP-binding protein
VASVDLLGLRKAFGEHVVADGIDLAVQHGELVCLLGPSGCGKTTTLRLIAGFTTPDAGSILVGGKVLSSPGQAVPPERRKMSMIFQSYALWPHMSVVENVAYGLRLRRLPRAEIERKVTDMLAVAKLSKLRDRFPGELSGGQQQRVALARALVVEPETLLLDEPLSNLDTNLREEMRFEIRRLHDEFRYTTLYVTHDQAEAMTTADRIVVMNGGRIEQVGSPEDIYQRPQSEFVARFIGATNILRGYPRLRCGNRDGAADLVSIRPNDIQILPTARVDGPNEAVGTVRRHTYLGAQRDYLVELTGDVLIRVTTGVETMVGAGEMVGLRFPPECCRALPS